MARNEKKHVLVAPLDWGLGHATRCIPIIHELLKKNCEVLIASSGNALVLLEKEFPQLVFFELPAYNATYSTTLPFMVKIAAQVPGFLWTIRKEHMQVQQIVQQRCIDFIISDSRFGCWSNHIPTVFISHQTNILMPSALKWVEPVINFFNRYQIRKFTQCWVPDFPHDRVTGDLTRTKNLSVRFIGMLSRFRKSEKVPPVKYDYLVLASGPEPQRTVFENMMRKNMDALPGRKLMVKGKPGGSHEIMMGDSFEEADHLASDLLQEIIESSAWIISRSGYTTVMDLARLGKRAFFIPTPGQTEQEQLAIELKKRRIAFYQDQRDFDLPAALKEMDHYHGFDGLDHSPDLLQKALDDLLQK